MPIKPTSDPTAPNSAFLTVDQAAAYLNVSSDFVYRRCENGELTAHRFGRALRLTAADLDRFAADRRG